MIKVFICHSSLDKNFARRLRKDLEVLGFNVWIDDSEIGVGDSIVKKIQEGLATSDAAVLVVTPDAMKSHWVEDEWTTLYSEQIETGRIKIFPVMAKRTDNLPKMLRKHRYEDMTSDRTYPVGLTKLCLSIKEQHQKGNLNQTQFYSSYDEFFTHNSLHTLLDKPRQVIQFVSYIMDAPLFRYDDRLIIDWISKSQLFEIVIAKNQHSNLEELSEIGEYYKKRFAYSHLHGNIKRCQQIYKSLPERDKKKFKLSAIDVCRVNVSSICRFGDMYLYRLIGFNQQGQWSPAFTVPVESGIGNWIFTLVNNLHDPEFSTSII